MVQAHELGIVADAKPSRESNYIISLDWRSIVLGTISLRFFVTFPIAIYTRRQLFKVNRLLPLMNIVKGNQFGDVKSLYARFGYNPLGHLLLPIVQIPIFITLSYGLRYASGLGDSLITNFANLGESDPDSCQLNTLSDAQSKVAEKCWRLGSVPAIFGRERTEILLQNNIKSGGFWPWSDLSKTDYMQTNSLIVPLMLSSMHLGNLYMTSYEQTTAGKSLRDPSDKMTRSSIYGQILSTKYKESGGSNSRVALDISKQRNSRSFIFNTLFGLLAVLTFPVSMNVPMCINLYWLTSAGFSIIQNLAFRSKFFHRIFINV